MVDYAQRVFPPEYRNLVINPSGESAYAASWTSTNGTVIPGSTATTPLYGVGVAEYTVEDQSLPEYTVTPFGPEGHVHRHAFATPGTQTISARASVTAPTVVWAQLQARYMVWSGDAFQDLETYALTPAAQVLPGVWVELQGFSDSIPEGATHWALDIALYMQDPSGTAPLTDPPLGTKLWIDGVFVPDSGVDLTGVPYIDGTRPNAYWEGEPNFSSSRTGTKWEPYYDDSAPAIVDEYNPNDVSEVNPDEDEPDEYVEVTDTPTAEVPKQLGPRGEGEVLTEEELEAEFLHHDVGYWSTPASPAERWASVVATLSGSAASAASSGRLCLNEDIQLSELRLNAVDGNGTIWVVTDVEGWWTLPEADVPDVPRGWDDGSWETRGRYTARTITLNGVFIPRSKLQVAEARTQLVRAANLCHRGDYFMTFDHRKDPDNLDDDMSLYAKGSKVWLSGAPQIATTSASGKTEFSIGLRAPDPVKYSILNGIPPGYNMVEFKSRSQRWPGRSYDREYSEELGYWKYPDAVFGATEGIAVNQGDVDVKPILEVFGPSSGPIVILNLSTEQQMRVNQRLFPGEVLRIDCNRKTVSLNELPNQRFYLDMDVDWFTLQSGANHFYFLEEAKTNPKTKIRVYWRSGWIG